MDIEELEPHDSHVRSANAIFRDCGFSLLAMQFKRSPEALQALREFNRVPVDWKHPFPWNYHPNEWCRNHWFRYLPCPHDYENTGYVGGSVFYRCAICGDEYEKDVS